MKSVITIICLSIVMIAGGCAELQGNVIRTYHSGYRAAVQASSEALQNLAIPIVAEESDELATRFLARRPSGIPVTVEITRVDQYFTRVSVRTGEGIDRYTDQEVSNQIHAFIRGKLGDSVKVE